MSLPSLIPSGAPNHDDWNELFNDLVKLGDRFFLNDGCKFFMSDPAERFGFSHKLDWTEFLHGRSIASHIPCGVSLRLHFCLWFLHILVFALSMSWVARDDLPISVVCFVSRVCIPHAQCLDLLCPGFEVGVDHLLRESISSVGCVSAAHQISSTGIGMPGREDHDPPDDGDDRRGGDRGHGGENGLAYGQIELFLCLNTYG